MNLHPIEHCLNEHAGGRTPYTSASKLPKGVPSIKGEPIWIDINKLKANQVISYEDILKMSDDFLKRNSHLRTRFEIWKRAAEREWLIKGNTPPEAITTKNGIRLKGALRMGGKALFLYAVYVDTRALIDAEDKSGEAARIAGGWAGAWAGGCVGAASGAAIAAVGGQAGPQVAAPEEVVTVPVFGLIGGFIGGMGGYWAGSTAGRNYYDFIKNF